MVKWSKEKHIWKFLLVGVINTLVGSSVMFISYNVFGFSYMPYHHLLFHCVWACQICHLFCFHRTEATRKCFDDDRNGIICMSKLCRTEVVCF